MKTKGQKPFWKMNTKELAAATAELNQEFVIDKCTPLTPAMRARWEKAKRKSRRSRNGQGVRVVAVRLTRRKPSEALRCTGQEDGYHSRWLGCPRAKGHLDRRSDSQDKIAGILPSISDHDLFANSSLQTL